MILDNPKESKTIFQTVNEEETLPEDAFVVCNYRDGIISLEQRGNTILINKGSVNELIKVLKEYKNTEPKID